MQKPRARGGSGILDAVPCVVFLTGGHPAHHTEGGPSCSGRVCTQGPTGVSPAPCDPQVWRGCGSVPKPEPHAGARPHLPRGKSCPRHQPGSDCPTLPSVLSCWSPPAAQAHGLGTTHCRTADGASLQGSPCISGQCHRSGTSRATLEARGSAGPLCPGDEPRASGVGSTANSPPPPPSPGVQLPTQPQWLPHGSGAAWAQPGTEPPQDSVLLVGTREGWRGRPCALWW